MEIFYGNKHRLFKILMSARYGQVVPFQEVLTANAAVTFCISFLKEHILLSLKTLSKNTPVFIYFYH